MDYTETVGTVESALERKSGRFAKFPRSQAAYVALELAKEVYRVSAEENSHPQVVSDRLDEAIDFLEQVQEILNPLTAQPQHFSSPKFYEETKESFRRRLSEYELKEAPERRIWHFPIAEFGLEQKPDSPHSWFVDREQLVPLCATYVENQWMHSKRLDRILIHALVYVETHAFGIDVRPALAGVSSWDAILHPLKPGEFEKKTSRKEMVKAAWGLGWFVAIIGLGIAAYVDTGRLWIGVSLCLSLLLVYGIADNVNSQERNRARSKITDLQNEMQWVSKQIAMSPESLAFLRERLAALTEKGVRWNGAIFAILDKAIRRGISSW